MTDNPWHTVLAAEAFAGMSAFARTFDRLPLAAPDGADLLDALRALGFEVGEPVPEPGGRPPLFVEVGPPEGWRLRPLEDPAYVDVVDACGSTRARTFFKPAHYDRRATIELLPRFGVEPRTGEAGTVWQVLDRELGEAVFSSGPVGPCPEADEAGSFDRWAASYGAARHDCVAWLAASYPEEGPLAYWSDVAPQAPRP